MGNDPFLACYGEAQDRAPGVYTSVLFPFPGTAVRGSLAHCGEAQDQAPEACHLFFSHPLEWLHSFCGEVQDRAPGPYATTVFRFCSWSGFTEEGPLAHCGEAQDQGQGTYALVLLPSSGMTHAAVRFFPELSFLQPF